MKSLMIVAASLMIVANVQAEESLEIGVEMTPLVESKQVATANSDERFSNYALENSASN